MHNRLGRRLTFLVLPGLLLVACSSDRTARHPAPSPSPSATQTQTQTQTQTAPVAETIDAGRIEALPESACEIATAGDVPVDARLRLYSSTEDVRDERPLVQARYQSAKFSLRPGNADETLASVESSGWGTSLSALLPTKRVPIWVKQSRQYGNGMLTSGPKSEVQLVRVERGSAVIRFELGPKPIEETIACEDLVATPPQRVASAPGKERQLEAAKGVEILPAPTSPAGSGVVVNTPKASIPIFFDIVELERKGRFAKVQIPSLHGTVTGWVPVANVRPASKEEYANVGLLTGNSYRGSTEPGLLGSPLACPHAVRLAAIPKKGENPVWVGEIGAETPLVLADAEAVRTSKDPPAPNGWIDVKLAGIAFSRIVVRASDVKGCQER